ncbi:GAF domain-containing protein [Candidatus Kapabacteria bacterium]|nr:GAF domain-containing protein [Candidatus Kapabacteria bacterium]
MKSLTPSDILLIIIIISGLLLTILVDVIAVQIIGAGLTIIFSVGLFMIIAQRQKEYIDSRNSKSKPKSPNYNVTVKKDNSGTRKTFEEFAGKNTDEDIEETEFSDSDISVDEGFRIIKKNKNIEEAKSEDKIIIKPKIIEADIKANPPSDVNPKISTEEIIEEKNNDILPDIKKEINDIVDEEKLEIPQTPYLDMLLEDAPNSDEPKREFEYCVSRLLTSIRAVSSTRSALFFLVNNNKNEIKLESYATDVPDKLNKKIRFSFGTDLISSVAKNKKPEIVTEINSDSEEDLIPYYNTKSDIKSFIGVPVFYDKKIVGVLCADSPLTDAYDSVMVNFLSQFNSLISTLLGSYIEKYDLIHAFKSLEAINLFQSKQANEDNDIMWSLLESISDIAQFNSIGIIVWNDEKSVWYCAAEAGDTEFPLFKEHEVDKSSIVNRSIENKKFISHDIKSKSETFISLEEKIDDIEWVASIPVFTNNAVFGAVVLANKIIPDGDEETEIAINLAQFAASAIEKVQLLELLSQNSVYDYDSGLMNKVAFQDTINREFDRAKQLNTQCTLCLINIDKYASFDPGVYQKRMEAMISHVIRLTNESKQSFDLLGKVDDKLFGVVLIGKGLDSSKIWAEKLRSEVATSMIKHDSSNFNVTISVGISSYESANNPNEFINNSLAALKISLEKTNFVSIYS